MLLIFVFKDIMSDMSDPQVGHIKAESEDNANQVMVVEGSSTQLASIQKVSHIFLIIIFS